VIEAGMMTEGVGMVGRGASMTFVRALYCLLLYEMTLEVMAMLGVLSLDRDDFYVFYVTSERPY
jgi:hypothetical protein